MASALHRRRPRGGGWLVFGVRRFPKMIRSPSCVAALTNPLLETQPGDSLAFLFFLSCAFFVTRREQNRFHMHPIVTFYRGYIISRSAVSPRPSLAASALGETRMLFLIHQAFPR